MSKAEKTKEYIIEKSAPVFNMQGYTGTSLSDVIQITGLTKGSIYGNFKNKDELAIDVYRYNIKELGKQIADAINSKESAPDKLIAFTHFYRTNWKKIFEKGGCPILNAAVEADDSVSFLKTHVQHSIKSLSRTLSNIINEGQKNAELKKTVNADEFAYTIITMLEGGMMLSKIMNNQKLLFSALDRIEKLINEELKK